jgi:hypothetical protein
MMEPWFDPNQYAWIPGTLFGVLGGVMGTLAGWLAPSGRAKRFVLSAWFTFLGLAVVSLVAGLVALMSGQPYGVWYGLLLPGADGTIVIGVLSLLVVKRYREAEARRMAAKDFVSE